MPQDPDQKTPKKNDFVHLHLHTDYSLLQSTVQLKPLATRLGELEMKACAITDLGNMYGAVSFFNKMKDAGVKPIIGYEAHFVLGSRHDRNPSIAIGERAFYNIVLLATDLAGYHNLSYLASKAFTEGYFYRPRIDLELLAERSKGLIALSGGADGAISHFLSSNAEDRALALAEKFSRIFGKDRFYLEIQDAGGDRTLIEKVAEFSKKTKLPLVATNDVFYINREDARAREALIAINDGRSVPSEAQTEARSFKYLRSADEMWEIFGKEFPEALRNTLRIAEICNVEIPQGDDVRQLPNFPIPAEFSHLNSDQYFEKVVRDGFNDRLKKEWRSKMDAGELRHSLDEYEARLATEIATINRMGFPGYFLIVWDFIKYAREKNIPVGPGRGSAAGSLVAYCLNITDVDPLEHELLFERFLNPERISMPDIDIDFCIRGRGDVIDHVTNLYGRESVCQIVTFGTMASKAAIKDVGRVLGVPLSDVERIAKLMPPPVRGRNISISQALEQVPEIKAAMQADPRIDEMVTLALKVEGCHRHTSVHAAGVVISPKPLHELVPVAVSGKEELTSQYPMGDLEAVGMLKMDFLGLTTLTIISDALAEIQKRRGETIDWTKVPTDDPKTMKIFADGKTDAIFQFESSGMQEICRKMRPENLEDLSALNALYRPGPIDGGMIDLFVDRRRGVKEVEYWVPEVEEFLKPTFGVLVYQEQIMQIAQRLAGYSLGDADLMRRAMGKKKIAEMAKHTDKFVNGATANGIKKKTAEEIFSLMSKFADYGFNRSHSIAYAVLAFRTAYLKAHFPSFFYASVLSHEADDSAKVYKYSTELRQLGLELLPPDINESGLSFTPLETSVRFGLQAIKGIGASSVQSILRARESGPFKSLNDFVSRLDAGALNRRGLESLIAAGALDSLMPAGETIGSWRAKMHASVDSALRFGARASEDRMSGQNALFGGDASFEAAPDQLPDVPGWSAVELSKNEKAAIGFYLSTHPLDAYGKQLDGLKIPQMSECFDARPGDQVRMMGMVTASQVRYSKKGNRFCIFRLEDRTGGSKCLVWAEAYAKHQQCIADDEIVVIEGKVEAVEAQELTVIVSDIKPIADVITTNLREVSIKLPRGTTDSRFLEDLFILLTKNPGRCEVMLDIEVDGVGVKLKSEAGRIAVSRSLTQELESKGCTVAWG
jgi:DNA polymerase III subunit alpha